MASASRGRPVTRTGPVAAGDATAPPAAGPWAAHGPAARGEPAARRGPAATAPPPEFSQRWIHATSTRLAGTVPSPGPRHHARAPGAISVRAAMMHMRAGFDHPHNAAAGLPGRADGAPGSGVGCSVRGQAGWPLIIAGRFSAMTAMKEAACRFPRS